MKWKEVDAKAAELAERASMLSPEEGDRLIRAEANNFPQGLRSLLQTASAKLAEQKRLDLLAHQNSMDLENQKVNNQLRIWGCRVGVGGVVVALMVVLFIAPKPTPAQWFVIRLITSMGGAGFASALSGFLEIKAKWGVVAVIAGGALAVFWLTYFWNPPALVSAY